VGLCEAPQFEHKFAPTGKLAPQEMQGRVAGITRRKSAGSLFCRGSRNLITLSRNPLSRESILCVSPFRLRATAMYPQKSQR
jgi:hypothetical protein